MHWSTLGTRTPQDLSPFGKRITILIGLTVLGLMSVGLALSFYRNILFEQTLERLANSNAKMRAEIEASRRQVDYFRSAQYRDKAAKENLGLIRAEEKVLVLVPSPPSPLAEEGELTAREVREAAYEEYLRRTPTFEHWQLYLFDREGLRKLREAFF